MLLWRCRHLLRIFIYCFWFVFLNPHLFRLIFSGHPTDSAFLSSWNLTRNALSENSLNLFFNYLVFPTIHLHFFIYQKLLIQFLQVFIDLKKAFIHFFKVVHQYFLFKLHSYWFYHLLDRFLISKISLLGIFSKLFVLRSFLLPLGIFYFAFLLILFDIKSSPFWISTLLFELLLFSNYIPGFFLRILGFNLIAHQLFSSLIFINEFRVYFHLIIDHLSICSFAKPNFQLFIIFKWPHHAKISLLWNFFQI